MIDSHCHLADAVFETDLADVVARAREAGVTHVVTILAAGNAEEARRAGTLASLWDGARFAAGVHPHQAHECAEPGRATTIVRQALEGQPRVRAIGEIGLDYHYDFSPRGVQRAVFAEQVALAVALGLPVVIHTREAEDDTFDILRQEGRGRIDGVFHCFTGDEQMARRALDLGFSVSFAGIVTFPKGESVRDAARIVPDDRLLVETDSPFLAPAPHRGKRNEPAWVVRVADTLAAVRGVALPDLDAQLTANLQRFLGEDPPSAR